MRQRAPLVKRRRLNANVTLASGAVHGYPILMRNGGPPESWKVIPLDPNPVLVHTSPDPAGVFHANPSLLALSSGRLLAAIHLHGPGLVKQAGAKGHQFRLNHLLLGKIFSSNDKGETWQFRSDFPFAFARLFRDGESVYALGHKGNLQMIRSQDGGNSWNKPESLTPEDDSGGLFVQGPGNVLAHEGFLYAAFMKTRPGAFKGWPGSRLIPVVLRARLGSNLQSAKSWSFSTPEQSFADWFPRTAYEGFGIPFFPTPSEDKPDPIGGGRFANRIGWDDAHVLPLPPPPHHWHDPSALLLVCRTGLHRSNLAAVLKIKLLPDSPPILEPLPTPSGVPWSLIPWPGGNQKFDVCYDDTNGLYWSVGNRMTDSMTLPARLPAKRLSLPADEAGGLDLHFSRNLVDWSFAGLIEQPASPALFRTGAALAIKGLDLHVVARGGDESCRKLPETNLIMSYRIPEFRALAY